MVHLHLPVGAIHQGTKPRNLPPCGPAFGQLCSFAIVTQGLHSNSCCDQDLSVSGCLAIKTGEPRHFTFIPASSYASSASYLRRFNDDLCWRDESRVAVNIYVRSTDTIRQAKNVFFLSPTTFTLTCMQKKKNEFIARAACTSRALHVHFLIYIQFLRERTCIQRTTSGQRTTHRFIISIRVRELFCESSFGLCCLYN